jgi:hypothetical protein
MPHSKVRKIYIVGDGEFNANWMEGKRVKEMDASDLVVFTGGEDINPALYNRKPNIHTHFNEDRDKHEVAAFHQALSLNKKVIGICRGAQLLCAMAGGILVQDQSHPYLHKMSTKNGEVWVTSAHHQRQYPWSIEFELIGWCNDLSFWSDGENMQDDLKGKPEVEVAIYPKINALAIQSHPEWVFPPKLDWEKTFINFCRETLDKHMRTKYNAKVAA